MSWLTKMNKAWVAAVVAFLALQLQHFFGWELSVELQGTIVGIVTGLFAWLIPNYPSEEEPPAE